MSGAKAVLVTGAARRIGAAIARRLHAGGWRVALHCAASGEEARALAAGFNAARPGSAAVVAGDLRDPAVPAELIARTVAALGAPAALVHNASNYFAAPFGAIDAAAVDSLYAVNLRAPLLLTQAAHAAGALQAVVTLLDVHAREQPRAGFAAYTAAKAALWSLTESLAVELAPAVRVNGLALGHIAAEVGDPPSAAELADLADKAAQLIRVPLQRAGTPGEVAAAVAWLVSDEARYVSGAILPLDGGRRLA